MNIRTRRCCEIFIIIVLCQLNSPKAWGQVAGVVLDSEDRRPIAGASVYIDNSTIGTVTNQQGYFLLNTGSTSNSMVISHVSYIKQQFVITPGRRDTLVFMLERKVADLETFTVKVENKENWKKWGPLFRSHFIGISKFAEDCEIRNADSLRFTYNKFRKTLKVYSRGPLIIENNALGYVLTFDLDSFVYSFSDNMVLYSGTSFFTDMTNKSAKELLKYKSNRLSSYYGSRMHFMRSLYADSGTVRSEGYRVYRFIAERNEEKLRVSNMLLLKQSQSYEEGGRADAPILSQLTTRKDSAHYYKYLLSQPDYSFRDSIPVIYSERLTEADNAKAFYLPDSILVVYDRNVAAEKIDLAMGKAIKTRGYNEKVNENYAFFSKPKVSHYQYSLFYLIDGDYIEIEPNGFCRNGEYLFSDGSMSFKKIASLLPWDYYPPTPR